MIVELALVTLSFVGWLVVVRGRRPAPRTKLNAAPSTPWMLDHFCVSLRSVLREWPELQEIRLNVEAFTSFDDATIASLKGAIATATDARVRLQLDGYDVAMARRARLQGIDAKYFGHARGPANATLH
jgi:hypothetical protein